MLSVERFGVTIDQCTGCGGIFLDLGEIERLTEAEGRFYAAQSQLPLRQSVCSSQPSPTQPVYVEAPRQRGFLGGLFSGESSYGGRLGGHH
jgi:Zn-finger nucleic acid-binding protein